MPRCASKPVRRRGKLRIIEENAGPDNTMAERTKRSKEAYVCGVKTGTVKPGESKWQEASKKLLTEHLEDWIGVLKARRSNRCYVTTSKQKVLRLIGLTGAMGIADLSKSSVKRAFHELRSFKGNAGNKGLSDQSIKHYAGVMYSFTRWLREDERVERDPLDGLRMPGVIRKNVRRALTAEQASRLIENTRTQPKRWKLQGEERSIVYAIAIGTGFRLNELCSLEKPDFQLDSDPPTITVKAEHTKNGKEARQPIRPELATLLKPWLASKSDDERLIRFKGNDAAILVRADLEACGIDATGFDFHTLRHTYASLLVSSGVSPKVFQTLVRHSTATLTLETYAHASENDLANGLDGLAHTLTTRVDSKGQSMSVDDIGNPVKNGQSATCADIH